MRETYVTTRRMEKESIPGLMELLGMMVNGRTAHQKVVCRRNSVLICVATNQVEFLF